jgi:glutaminase
MDQPLVSLLAASTQAQKDPRLFPPEQLDQWLSLILDYAQGFETFGSLPDYIPELAQVDPDQRAISLAFLHGSTHHAGNASQTPVTIQSVVKPFLYLFALSLGINPEAIAAIEAPALPFHSDPTLSSLGEPRRPGHPLNNAGAISAAGFLEDLEPFQAFLGQLMGQDPPLVNESVFSSEMGHNANNRALAYRLVVTGRFSTLAQAENALMRYTRACALEVTTTSLTRAGLVLANGGRGPGGLVVAQDLVVRTLNAMNTFGLYDHTAELSLLAAGARALSCKSGVGGLILNIDPSRGACCTFGPKLDSKGNSVFGTIALIFLNALLSAPQALRLAPETVAELLKQKFGPVAAKRPDP